MHASCFSPRAVTGCCHIGGASSLSEGSCSWTRRSPTIGGSARSTSGGSLAKLRRSVSSASLEATSEGQQDRSARSPTGGADATMSGASSSSSSSPAACSSSSSSSPPFSAFRFSFFAFAAASAAAFASATLATAWSRFTFQLLPMDDASLLEDEAEAPVAAACARTISVSADTIAPRRSRSESLQRSIVMTSAVRAKGKAATSLCSCTLRCGRRTRGWHSSDTDELTDTALRSDNGPHTPSASPIGPAPHSAACRSGCHPWLACCRAPSTDRTCMGVTARSWPVGISGASALASGVSRRHVA